MIDKQKKYPNYGYEGQRLRKKDFKKQRWS